VLCNSEYRQLVHSELSGEVAGRSFTKLLSAMTAGIFRSTGQSVIIFDSYCAL